MTAGRRCLSVLVLLLLAASCGCASIKRLTASSEDIHVIHERRTAELARDFEARRDVAQFQAAQARWREGNLQACQECLDQLLERNSQFFEARLLMAEVLLSEEKFDLAREQLELAASDHPEDARTQHMLGLVLEAQGDDAEALSHYQRAAELEPQNEQYSLSCQTAARNFPEQQAAYVAQPSNAGDDENATESSLAIIPTAAVVPLPPVQPPVQAAVRTPPIANESLDVEQAFSEARQAFAVGDLVKARMSLSKAVSSDTTSPRLTVRAAVLALRYAQTDVAIQLLQPATTRFADSAALYRTLGTAYYRHGDFGAAQQALGRAISLDRSNALAYLLMGCTLEKLGQSSAAKAQFEEARRLDPRL